MKGKVQTSDRLLFPLFFILGSAGLLVVKAVEPPTFILILIPAIIIAFYSFLIWMSADFAENGEKKADSVYYLGFLFTMVSLSHTLWLMGQEGQDFEVVIGNFGVALSSTIISLACRIILTQLVPPSDEEMILSLEDQARHQLIEAAERLSYQLRHISGMLKKDSQSIYKNLRDTFTEASRDITDGMKESSNAFRKETEVLTMTLRRDARNISQSLQEIFKHITENISQSMGECVDQIKEVSHSTGARMKESMEEFNKRMEDLLAMTAQVNEATDKKLKSVEEAWASFQEMPSANEVLTKAVESLSAPLEQVVSNSADLSETFATQRNLIDEGRQNIQVATQELLKEIKGNSRDIQRIVKSLQNLQEHWEAYSKHLPNASTLEGELEKAEHSSESH